MQEHLGHFDGLGGVGGAAFAGHGGFRVAGHPGHDEDSSGHDEGGEDGFVFGGEGADGAVAVEPGGLEGGDDGVVFEEGDGGCEVVEEPGKAAVIEVDDVHGLVVDEEVGQAHVGVDEAEAVWGVAVGLGAALDFGHRAGDGFVAFLGEADSGLPGPPEFHGAEHGVEVPELAGEGLGAGPGGGVVVEAGGDGAEGVEPGDEAGADIGLFSREVAEGDGVAGGQA